MQELTVDHKTRLAPMLILKDGVAAIAFYKKAFGAIELRRFSNDDGSIHVAELSIDGCIFHIRQEEQERGQYSPGSMGGTTALTELWVADPVASSQRAVAAGAKVLSQVKKYDETGYMEGTIEDPFGHRWVFLRPVPDQQAGHQGA
jgi:PhnB protein